MKNIHLEVQIIERHIIMIPMAINQILRNTSLMEQLNPLKLLSMMIKEILLSKINQAVKIPFSMMMMDYWLRKMAIIKMEN